MRNLIEREDAVRLLKTAPREINSRRKTHGLPDLDNTPLEGVRWRNVELFSVNMAGADLSNGSLFETDLSGADLSGADLTGTTFEKCILTGLVARTAIVDGRTLFKNCVINEETDFTGTGLANARFDPPAMGAYLEYNIRRQAWREWGRQQPAPFRMAALWFWSISDYGTSAFRITFWFLLFAVVFAAAYVCPAHLGSEPPLLLNLNEVDGTPVTVNIWIRAIYFSIVTMTTLGFGDIHANPSSELGHVLLTIQVLIGYILLGALITRFAILFQDLHAGPARSLGVQPSKQRRAQDTSEG